MSHNTCHAKLLFLDSFLLFSSLTRLSFLLINLCTLNLSLTLLSLLQHLDISLKPCYLVQLDREHLIILRGWQG